MSKSSFEKGTKLEDIVEKIYAFIANDERIKAQIQTRVPLIGAEGTAHEFDVLYTYEHFGNVYRVAIECKNWNNPVGKNQVTDFAYKLKSVGNINGIFISNSDLQKGAKLVSAYENIRFINYKDFRKFSLSANEKYLTPNSRTIGDPFWMIMNLKEKRIKKQHIIIDKCIHLFPSYHFASIFRERLESTIKEKTVIVGVTQNHLKDIAFMINKCKLPIKICIPELGNIEENILEFHQLNLDELNWFIRD